MRLIYVLIGVFILIGVMSGCLKSGNNEFWNHVEKATDEENKRHDLWEDALTRLRNDDYEGAIELLNRGIIHSKNAQEYFSKAYLSTKDFDKQQYVICLNKTVEMFIRGDEMTILGAELEFQGKQEEALKMSGEINKLGAEIKNELKKCQILKEKVGEGK